MRTFLLVIDSFGIGELPDAEKYGDKGANTAVGIGRAVGGVNWPNLGRMGLGNASLLTGNEIPGCPPAENPESYFGVMKEVSPGKDTTTGHWEMAGIILEKAFPVFPPDYPSFPEELVDEFVKETGVPGILGNKAASGTEIIKELGNEHIKTKKPICYTSADSVFQIAVHMDVYTLEELYSMCETARRICDKYNVGRVIARPFIGENGNFTRTKDRHDWSIALPGKTLLDYLREANVETVAIGKIGSIFLEQGIDISYHDAGNKACIERTLAVAAEKTENDQFVFINLVDTDMVYGHRRDPEGYHNAVAEIDSVIPEIEKYLSDGDIIAITGDHGCDPTFRGTDHTREHVPLLYKIINKKHPGISADKANLGIRETFADLSASIQKSFNLIPKGSGTPFL